MSAYELLNAMEYIDADLIAAADAAPKKMNISWARWGIVAACICLLVVVAVFASRQKAVWPAAPGAVPPAPTDALKSAPPTDDAVSTVPSEESTACYFSVVTYRGGSYEEIARPDTLTLGAPLGTVAVDLKIYAGDLGADEIGSTILDVGDTVYAWAGYDSAFRICGRSADGTVRCFERLYAEGLSNVPVASLFPTNVVKIAVCDNEPTELGVIDDPTEIAALLNDFTRGAAFLNRADAEERTGTAGPDRRLYLTLADGSVTEFLLFNESVGHWAGYVSLPEGFFERIKAYEIYGGGEAVHHGALYAGIDYAYSAHDSVMEPVWAANGELRMGWCMQNRYLVLANDAEGCIRIENTDIWYLSLAGEAKRIRFEYPCDGSSSLDAVENGEDLSWAVTARETLYAGPYASMEVRGGVVWGLDATGTLYRNGEPFAQGVADFTLDNSGVLYGGETGLYRADAQNKSVRLTEAEVTAVASAGIDVYYATAAGEIRRVRLNGESDALVYDLSAASLCYFEYNGHDALAIVSPGGTAYLLYDGAVLYRIAENVAIFDAWDGKVAIRYLGGETEITWCSYEPENGGLYLRDELLHQEG
ncbi:MAG: hypothetical protein LLF87_05160 [Eubacteriales bacterium]|nr:hypothetical protein [Eubacteriales bacterium]